MAVSGDPSEPEPLLSPAQLAHICGLSRRAVYDAIARGELEAFRICARLRISTEQLDDWLRRSAVDVSAPPPRSKQARVAPTTVARRGSFRAKLAADTGNSA
jgi:excisionase family DNA binding protein